MVVTVLCDELDGGSGEGYYEAEFLLVFLSDDSACQCLIGSCYNLVSGANLTGAYCLLPDAIISLEGEYARLHSSPALFRLRLLRILLSNSIINHRFHWAYDLLWETTRSFCQTSPKISSSIPPLNASVLSSVCNLLSVRSLPLRQGVLRRASFLWDHGRCHAGGCINEIPRYILPG